MTPTRTLVWQLAALVGFLAVAPAYAQDGTGQLGGTEVLRVQGCGKDHAFIALSLQLGTDEAWRAEEATFTYTGAYRAVGRKGRKAHLTFDGPSRDLFVAVMEDWAADICGVSVRASAANQKKAVLKLNRKRTRATLVVVYGFRGSAAGESGTATYKLKVKGVWRSGGGILGGGGTTGGVCSGPGVPCAGADECCPDHLCVRSPNDATAYCAFKCTTSGECNSGCCASLEGGGGACGLADLCAPRCAQANEPCTTHADCCEQHTCVGDSASTAVCAANCTSGAQCASGCCAFLESGGRACAPASVCGG